jgi:hypothetical protein
VKDYAEAIAAELDELPLPYRFDVQALEEIRLNYDGGILVIH